MIKVNILGVAVYTLFLALVLGYLLPSLTVFFPPGGKKQMGTVISVERNTGRLLIDNIRVEFGPPYQTVDCKVPLNLSSVGDKIPIYYNNPSHVTCGEPKSKAVTKLLFVPIIILLVVVAAFWKPIKRIGKRVFKSVQNGGQK